jgi:hypothetical protein
LKNSGFDEIDSGCEEFDNFLKVVNENNIKLILSSLQDDGDSPNLPASLLKIQNQMMSLFIPSPAYSEIKQIVKISLQRLNISVSEDANVIISYLLEQSSINFLAKVILKLKYKTPEDVDDKSIKKIFKATIEREGLGDLRDLKIERATRILRR